MTTHHQDNAWVRALESPPPTTIYTTRTIERTATIDPRDNLPSVSAQSSDPKGPQTNVFADIEDDTWGSVIGIGDCTPEAMALVANMLSRVAKSRGHGTPVVIQIHPRGPTPGTDVPNATSSTVSLPIPSTSMRTLTEDNLDRLYPLRVPAPSQSKRSMRRKGRQATGSRAAGAARQTCQSRRLPNRSGPLFVTRRIRRLNNIMIIPFMRVLHLTS